MERVLILSADAWDMTDERTGRPMSGISVWYANDYREDTEVSFGYKPTKVAATPEILSQLKGNLPGIFDINFGSRPGTQNKATLTLISVQKVAPIDLFGKHTTFSPAPKSLETKQAEKF